MSQRQYKDKNRFILKGYYRLFLGIIEDYLTYILFKMN